jgi:ABC-type nitrate/sulfonate/bicarbonate transport system substrate-binding protein
MLNAIRFVEPVLHSLARADGLLDVAEIEFDVLLTGSSDEQFGALRDGDRDFAVTSMDNVIMWKRRPGGEAMRLVAQVEGMLAIDLVARPDVSSVAELAGARLLVDSAENGFVVALHKLLHDEGVDYAGCTILESGGVKQRLQALLAGKGDAASLGPPFTQMAQAQGMKLIANVNQRYPGFAGQGIIIRTDLAADKLAEFERYLAACSQALASAMDDPAAAVERLAVAGMPAPMAQAMVSALGQSLVPDRIGVDMLAEHRRAVGRPGGEDGYQDLVDMRSLHRALATAS